jgi:hypothetical protein
MVAANVLVILLAVDEPSLERYVLPGIVYEWSFAMSTVLLKIKFGTVVSQFMSKYGFIGIS